MVPQLEEDLLHLECSGQCLDQDCSADGVVRDSYIGLREDEDIVPETRLQVVLHFWEVEIGTGTTFDELAGVVVEVECKIEQGAGHWCIVDGDTGFVQVPSSGSTWN